LKCGQPKPAKFFEEVIAPVANAAGFAVKTALRQGSEVIQSSRLALRCTKSWFLA